MRRIRHPLTGALSVGASPLSRPGLPHCAHIDQVDQRENVLTPGVLFAPRKEPGGARATRAPGQRPAATARPLSSGAPQSIINQYTR